MAQISLPAVPERKMLFLLGAVYGFAGIICASFLSVTEVGPLGIATGPLGVALCALGTVEIMKALFARHRDLSWAPDGDPRAASSQLILNLISVLGGIIFAFVVFASMIPATSLETLFSFQMKSIFTHPFGSNASFEARFAAGIKSGTVLLGLAFILGAIYKEAGMALALSWIGSMWGVGVSELIGESIMHVKSAAGGLVLLALATSSAGIISGGITGLFLARGAYKYSIRSDEYRRVAHGSLIVFAGGMGFIFFSSTMTAIAGSMAAQL